MSERKYSSKFMLLLALSLLFAALFTLPNLQAQSKKEEKKPEKKEIKIRIEEATTRSGNTARVKPDFEFVKSGANRATVRSLHKDTKFQVNGNFSCKCEKSGGSCAIV